MANVAEMTGGQDILNPQQLSGGYLHPILLAFLNSLPNPNIVIQQHPAFPILAQTHPDQSVVASMGSAAPGFADPSASLTSGTGVATTAAAPKVAPTANSQTFGMPEQGLTANTPGSSGGLAPVGSPAASTPGKGGPTPSARPGIPNPSIAQSPMQPLPRMGPNATPPIGNTSNLFGVPPTQAPPQFSTSGPKGIPVFGGGSGFNSAPPISGSNPLNQNTSGVVAGPQALNHVPYGPELTGLSGFGGLITPNGTPVAMSAWQKMMLDPTSIARYNSYVSDVAGMNPADLAQIGQTETANKMADLKAPIKFAGIEPIAAPAGG